MKRYLSVGTLLLVLCGLVACQAGDSFSISNQNESNLSSGGTSTKPIATYNWIHDSKSFQPIVSSNVIEPVSTIDFDLKMNKIDEEAAQNLVDNDISKYPPEKSLNKKTAITYTKEHTKVMSNRSTNTYSVKEIVTEKYSVHKVDYDKKWCFVRHAEDTTTSYFVEEDLVRHIVSEILYFLKDNCFYTVYSEQNYYEGNKKEGVFDSYFVKRENLDEEEYISKFSVDSPQFTYFNETDGFGMLAKSVYNNFASSSSYYEANNYENLSRNTNSEYYSSSENGDFRYLADDSGEYYFADLMDYPSFEMSALSKISYEQNYSLTIIDYLNFVESYETNSISKDNKGEAIRTENKIGKKTVVQECETFNLDLNNFEEREYTPPIHK